MLSYLFIKPKKVVYFSILVAFFSLGLGGCGKSFDSLDSQKTTKQKPNPPDPEPNPEPNPNPGPSPEPHPDPNPQPSCRIYPKLNAGSCAALTALNQLPSSIARDYEYPRQNQGQYRNPLRLIDLEKVNLQQKVTQNFSLGEFMQLFKGRYGLIAEHLLIYAQKVRELVGVPLRVNSGYRSPAYNKKVGGVQLSRHMFGDAMDLTGAPNAEIKKACNAVGASYIQVYTHFVHCDWRNHKLDSTFYDPTRTNGPFEAAQLALMNAEAFKSLQIQLQGRPQVEILGELVRGSTVQLVATLSSQEDDGELFTEWRIQNPSGRVDEGLGSQFNFSLLESGRYVIYVRTGGFVDNIFNLDIP